MQTVADKGYKRASVADVFDRTGIPPDVFHREFGGKDECLTEACNALVDTLVYRVSDHFDHSHRRWPEKVRAALAALLAKLAVDPAMTRTAAIELPGTGKQAQQRYREALQRFVPFLDEGRDHAPHSHDLPTEIGLMAVGAAEAIIFAEIVAGRVERLQGMLPEILFAVLVPYLGPEQAAEEVRGQGGQLA